MKIQQWNRFTHDLGFMFYLPFSAAYRVERNPQNLKTLLRGARTLASRFKPIVGLIHSRDHVRWKYPVIIDNMMNLNYLFWASEFSGDEIYKDMAVHHADLNPRAPIALPHRVSFPPRMLPRFFSFYETGPHFLKYLSGYRTGLRLQPEARSGCSERPIYR